MIPGDEWQREVGESPTPADMMKYAATGAKLLVDRPYAGPLEIVITGTVNGGTVFSYQLGSGFGFDRNWLHTSDIRVLAMLPPPEPLPPKRSELTNDVLTKALSRIRHPRTE